MRAVAVGTMGTDRMAAVDTRIVTAVRKSTQPAIRGRRAHGCSMAREMQGTAASGGQGSGRQVGLSASSPAWLRSSAMLVNAGCRRAPCCNSRSCGGCCRCHHACDKHAGSQSCGCGAYGAGRGDPQASRSLGGVRGRAGSVPAHT